MNDLDYDVQKESWFSPNEIINNFELIRRTFGNHLEKDNVFKKAREMFAGAVALLGAFEFHNGNLYYMQINSQSSSPDIMAALRTKQQDGSILLEMLQIELVELEDHYSNNDIVQFLKDTKLSRKKGYGEKMMIICFVNRIAPINYQDIHERLKQLAPKPTIYICGRPMNSPMGTFMMFSPYPTLTKPLIYNINETAKKYSIKPRIDLSLGTGNTMKKSKLAPLSVYQILGLNKDKIYKKYKFESDPKTSSKIQ